MGQLEDGGGGNRTPGHLLSSPIPTGTGKTVVALHIVFWFHKCNDQVLDSSERRRSGPHILYCGPSNKSVDVLAGA